MELHVARRAAGLTQVQLAERSGVDQRVISSIERGRVQRPSWDTVHRLSVALDVSPDVLFPVVAAQGAA